MVNESHNSFFAVPSFEPRSIVALQHHLAKGGLAQSVHAVCLCENNGISASSVVEARKREFMNLGVPEPAILNRMSARSLWDWVWLHAYDMRGAVTIDATCFTRELLGMVLFALSVRRDYLDSVTVHYVLPGPELYVTQNQNLPETERWLTKGLVGIRSIVGYPGEFRSEQLRHVVALAGHEEDRLFDILEFLEPNELSISSERTASSTVKGADLISEKVATAMRSRIAVPKINPVDFSANSIASTFECIIKLVSTHSNDNLSIVSMNTKLAFIGAALAALHSRYVRLVYAVPEQYNPNYTSDAGDLLEVDITNYIRDAKTIRAQSNQE